MSIPIEASSVEPASGTSYPEPFKSRMGESNWRALGDAFGLTQFGFNLETFQPGSESALRHWHSSTDELVYVLEGELTLLVDEGEFLLGSGMCVGFKAGDQNAHHLVNRSEGVAVALVVGTRDPNDKAFYPDDDLAWFPQPDGYRAVHKDGSAYPEESS